MRWLIPSPHRRRATVVLLLAGLAGAGCGGKQMGSVSGKVTYKGKPVTAGEVQFFAPQKGAGASGKLDESGAFTLFGQIEAGTYKVYVQPPLPEQLPPGTKPKKGAKFDLPKKFQDAQATPVTKDIKPGKNDIAIDLTD